MSVTVLSKASWKKLQTATSRSLSHRRKSYLSAKEPFPALQSARDSQSTPQGGVSYSQAAKKAMTPRQPGDEDEGVFYSPASEHLSDTARTPAQSRYRLGRRLQGDRTKCRVCSRRQRGENLDLICSFFQMPSSSLSAEPVVILVKEKRMDIYEFPALASNTVQTKMSKLFAEVRSSGEMGSETVKINIDTPSPSNSSSPSTEAAFHMEKRAPLDMSQDFDLESSQKIFDIVAECWPLKVLEDYLSMRNLYFHGSTRSFRPINSNLYHPTANHSLKMYYAKEDGSMGQLVRSKGWDTRHFTFVIKMIDGTWKKCMTLKDRFKSRRQQKMEILNPVKTFLSFLPSLSSSSIPTNTEQTERDWISSLLLIYSRYPFLINMPCTRDGLGWEQQLINQLASVLEGDTATPNPIGFGLSSSRRSPSPRPKSTESPSSYQLFPSPCGCTYPQCPKGFISPPCPHRDSFAFQPPAKFSESLPSRDFPKVDLWTGPPEQSRPKSPSSLYSYPQITNLVRPQYLIPCESINFSQPPPPLPFFLQQQLLDTTTLNFFGPRNISSNTSTAQMRTEMWRQAQLAGTVISGFQMGRRPDNDAFFSIMNTVLNSRQPRTRRTQSRSGSLPLISI